MWMFCLLRCLILNAKNKTRQKPPHTIHPLPQYEMTKNWKLEDMRVKEWLYSGRAQLLLAMATMNI